MNKMDDWKKIILSINDNSFFDLMRNYLGKIETPFNKQDLIIRLINFFNREDTKNVILQMLDGDDQSLLTAIHLLKGPHDSQLQELFSEWTYLELHNRIQNLEERFLIYKKGKALYITPLFEEILLEKRLSPSHLITTKNSESALDPQPWLNDPLMLALLSFIQKNNNLIKIDGTIKKRGITELETVFPTIFSGEEGYKRFEICTSVLNNLNLIYNDDSLICTNLKLWNDLSLLEDSKRYTMYFGAALAENNHEVKHMISFFINLFNKFPKDKAISKSSINRYYKLYAESDDYRMPLFQLNKITDILKNLNILIENDDFIKINSLLDFKTSEVHNEPALIIQPNFELTVKPFITLKSCITLATAIELKTYDLFSHYTLTRDSFLRAFDKGIKSEEILATLSTQCGKDIPQNVTVSLKDWEEDHKKVKLYSGVVLKVSSDKQMLIENTDFLTPYIKENLAPGIYLLDKSQERLWMEALGELSISPLPASGEEQKETVDIPVGFMSLTPEKSLSAEKTQWVEEDINDSSQIDSRIKILMEKLEKSGIKGDEKKEIKARISRKLIILEKQINSGIIRPEITEAKGMNFQGKIRLIESALSNKSDRLELTHYAPEGVEYLFVQPVELVTEEKEKTLIGKILPDEELIKIKISKISKVKKIRSSLF